MRKSFKSIVAGVAALCVVGVMSAVGATSASAAAAPFTPTDDPNMIGTVTFYDAAGLVVTSGDGNSSVSPKYAVGSADAVGAPHTDAIRIYNPQPLVNPGLWSGIQLNGNTPWPMLTAPAPVGTSLLPASAMLATSQSFYAGRTTFIPNTGALANMYQIRLQAPTSGLYSATTISIDPVTHVWQQVDPTVADSTKTVVTQSGTSNGTAPQSDTLTATVSRTAGTQAPVPAGNVQFMDGTTAVGSPVAVNASGVATLAQPAVPAGTYAYNAVFTPTAPTVWITSTSAPVAFVVNAPVPTPAVTLTVDNAAPSAGVAVNFTSTTTPVDPGTIQLFDGATALGTAVPAAATNTFSVTFTTAINHPVTAKFVPTDPALFGSATSSVVNVGVLAVVTGDCLLPGSKCLDAQAFTVNVPAGSIIISTPYHSTNPFNIGTMTLNSAGTQYSTLTQGIFGSKTDPTLGVTITDTRAGGKGWTASLQSSEFANTQVSPVGHINAGNLGFTGVTPQYITGNALGLGGNVVSVLDNAAPAVALATAAPAAGLAIASEFASTVSGAGSVNVTGLFTLVAPSSVPAGLYNGTVTFTII